MFILVSGMRGRVDIFVARDDSKVSLPPLGEKRTEPQLSSRSPEKRYYFQHRTRTSEWAMTLGNLEWSCMVCFMCIYTVLDAITRPLG
jgi:hypothetical protein